MRAFYVNEHFNIVFPKREIYNAVPHELWFKDEGIPSIGVIKGYFHEDHITVFMNDLDIPPIHPAVLMDWFNTYRNCNYIELGGSRIRNNYVPKMVVFKGGQLNLSETLASAEPAKEDDEEDAEEREDKNTTEDKTEDLVEEASKIGAKKKVGFKV
jgi:hypothetical protein